MAEKRLSIVRRITLIILCIILLLTTFGGCGRNDGPEITSEFISKKLEPMSELISAKMTYNGIIQYTDGNVPFFTLKEFLMVYSAEVKAGIDLSQIEIHVTESDVTIIMPDEVTVDVKIDPDSIKFYAEKNALFNKEEKEDVVGAMKAAEDHVMENGGIDELKKLAREEAVLLIRTLVQELIGERSLTVIS